MSITINCNGHMYTRGLVRPITGLSAGLSAVESLAVITLNNERDMYLEGTASMPREALVEFAHAILADPTINPVLDSGFDEIGFDDLSIEPAGDRMKFFFPGYEHCGNLADTELDREDVEALIALMTRWLTNRTEEK